MVQNVLTLVIVLIIQNVHELVMDFVVYVVVMDVQRAVNKNFVVIECFRI